MHGERELAIPCDEVLDELLDYLQGAGFELVQRVVDGDFEGERHTDVILLEKYKTDVRVHICGDCSGIQTK